MYKHDAGTSGTVTVPDGHFVWDLSCLCGGVDGELVITPAGGSAQPTIVLIADQPFGMSFSSEPNRRVPELPGGSTLAFAGTVSYVVRYLSA